MQPPIWRNELLRISVICGAGLALGWSFGQPLSGLVLGLIATVGVMFSSMLNFYRWAQTQQLAPEEGLLGYSADLIIRQEKALSRTIDQQQKLLARHFQGIESLQDGVLILDNRGYILHFNKVAKQLLNLRLEDKGQIVTNLIRNPRLKEYLQENNSTEFVQIDVRHRQNLTLQIQMTGFGTEQKLLLIQNITERKKVEHMRQSFIANASHELRTPLTVINGYLEILENFDADLRQHSIIKKMQQQSLRMKELIDDLIHLSKLETENQRSWGDWFDLKNLAYDVLNQLVSISQQRIEFRCTQEVDILGFAGEMHTIINNLLVNALKYGGTGQIIFSIDSSFNGVLVSVQDFGSGIAPEHIHHLTERFYRVDDDRSSDKGGSGLGLAIVKHALELHGSSLQIQSQLQQGSTFSFLLPAERSRIHK